MMGVQFIEKQLLNILVDNENQNPERSFAGSLNSAPRGRPL